MTNFGALAILALPKIHERHIRLLLVIEVIKPDRAGWRDIGAGLLAELAGLSPNTVRKAREELVAAGLIEYRAGAGRGIHSRYLLLFDVSEAAGKGTQHVGTFSGPEKVPTGGAKGYQPGARKGNPKNAPTSGNSNTVLQASDLQASDLSPRTLLEECQSVVAGLTERDLEFIKDRIHHNGGKSPVAVIKGRLRDGSFAELVEECQREPVSYSAGEMVEMLAGYYTQESEPQVIQAEATVIREERLALPSGETEPAARPANPWGWSPL